MTTRAQLSCWALGVVEYLKTFLELRRDGDVEFFTGGQAGDEPFLIKRNQVVVGGELRKARSTTAESCGSPLRNMMP